MKRFNIILFFISLLVFSCNEPDNHLVSIDNCERSDDCWELIKESNQYYDYIRYLNKFPETEHFDTALIRYIELQKSYFDSTGYPIWDCFRNCIKIEVDSIGEILFENDSIKLNDLRKAVLNQLINPYNDENLPEKEIISDSTGIEKTISKGFIYVIIRFNYPSILKDVCIELKKAIDDYKEYLSVLWYEKPINKLNEKELYLLESAFRTWYFFDKFNFNTNVSIDEAFELNEKIKNIDIIPVLELMHV